MTNGATSAVTAFQASGSAISQTLEAARSKVEERFLEGGTVLLSVMEVLNRLLSSLDNITKALDAGENGDAGAELRSTVKSLSDLPTVEKSRRDALSSLAETGYSLH